MDKAGRNWARSGNRKRNQGSGCINRQTVGVMPVHENTIEVKLAVIEVEVAANVR